MNKYLPRTMIKQMLIVITCFITMPTYGMMGRLRTGFQRAVRPALSSHLSPLHQIQEVQSTHQQSRPQYLHAFSCAGLLSYFATQEQKDEARFKSAQKSLLSLMNDLETSAQLVLIANDFKFLQPLTPEELLTLFMRTLPAQNPSRGIKGSFNIQKLFLTAMNSLSNEQLLIFMEALKTYRDTKLNRWIQLQINDSHALERMVALALEHGSAELKKQVSYELLPYVENLEFKKRWLTALNIYNPFESDIQGPLFSGHNEELFPYPFSLKLQAAHNFPNFEALLPAIADYVAQEYAQDRIVFFHGQSSIWIFFEKIYRALHELKRGKKISKDFIHMRLNQHSILSNAEREKSELPWPNFNNKPVLFANLIPNTGEEGYNSLDYAVRSWDQTVNRRIADQSKIFKDMLIDLDMLTEFEKFKKKNPHFLTELQELFNSAISEQGKHGRILVISMPKKLAHDITYLTNDDGFRTQVIINRIPTSDPVTIAEGFNQAHYGTQFAIKLIEELVNPDAAAAAEVKIVGFDPVFYWQTEEAQKVEAKIQEFVEEIKKIRDGEEVQWLYENLYF